MTDRITELKTMPYDQYLLTPEWQERREQALFRAQHRCQVCNNTEQLNVHHRTYERRGAEEDGDVTVLCHSCHSLYHRAQKMPDEQPINAPIGMAELAKRYIEQAHTSDDSDTHPHVVKTGYSDLDRMLGGGFWKSDLIILGGRPSLGKTSLAINIACGAAIAHKKVLFFSLEMGQDQIFQRLLAIIARIGLQQIREQWVYDNEWERLIQGIDRLEQLPVWLASDGIHTISTIRQQIKEAITTLGTLDFVVIDYLGLINAEPEYRRENMVQQISMITRGLKQVAREFNVPILVLAQFSRAIESRHDKRPQLSDLRDGGSQEQDAGVVLLLHRDDAYNPDTERKGLMDIIIAKQRNGPTGEATVHFHAPTTKVSDLEVSPETDDPDDEAETSADKTKGEE
jgi:replicative DNA helicase